MDCYSVPEWSQLFFQFAFNGAVHPETFIGDYHFQTPRREKVLTFYYLLFRCDSLKSFFKKLSCCVPFIKVENIVLNARFKWMLELFKKNRKEWPERVVITRDGVSEGQYRMVCFTYSFLLISYYLA